MKRINTRGYKDVTDYGKLYGEKPERKESDYFQVFIIGVLSSIHVSGKDFPIEKEIAVSILYFFTLYAIWHLAKKLFKLK